MEGYCSNCGTNVLLLTTQIPPVGSCTICVGCLEAIQWVGPIWFEKISWLVMPEKLRDQMSIKCLSFALISYHNVNRLRY